MAHRDIECIAYEVNTFPKTTTTVTPGAVTKVDFNKSYRGADNARIDADWRIQLMKEALDEAFDASLNAFQSQVLKLFMAPEFYFRGVTGAYDFETYDYIVEKLRELGQKPKYADWLIVFGSLLVGFELSPEKKAVDDVAVGGSAERIQNIVLIQEGGADGRTRVVVKEHMSQIDFVRSSSGYELDPALSAKLKTPIATKTILSSGLDRADVSHVPSGKERFLLGHTDNTGSGKELQKQDYDGLGIFESDAVCYGVEICLDHAMRRLRQSPVGKGQSYVQVQLVPSAGMTIQSDAVVACKEGIVFNCDGNGRSDVQTVDTAASGKDRSELSRVPVLNEKKLHQSGSGAMIGSRVLATPETSTLKVYKKVALPPASARGKGLFD